MQVDIVLANDTDLERSDLMVDLSGFEDTAGSVGFADIDLTDFDWGDFGRD
jgi:hypothetical protein